MGKKRGHPKKAAGKDEEKINEIDETIEEEEEEDSVGREEEAGEGEEEEEKGERKEEEEEEGEGDEGEGEGQGEEGEEEGEEGEEEGEEREGEEVINEVTVESELMKPSEIAESIPSLVEGVPLMEIPDWTLEDEVNKLKTAYSDLQTRYTTLKHQLEQIHKDIMCPICMDTYAKPIVLSCGHMMCFECLYTILQARNNDGRIYTCPTCREPIVEEPTRSYGMDNYFENIMASMGTNERTIYETRLIQAQRLIDYGLLTRLFGPRYNMDEDDNIFRCGNCNFEIADGQCAGCGESFPQLGGLAIGQDPDGGGYESNEDIREEEEEEDDDDDGFIVRDSESETEQKERVGGRQRGRRWEREGEVIYISDSEEGEEGEEGEEVEEGEEEEEEEGEEGEEVEEEDEGEEGQDEEGGQDGEEGQEGEEGGEGEEKGEGEEDGDEGGQGSGGESGKRKSREKDNRKTKRRRRDVVVEVNEEEERKGESEIANEEEGKEKVEDGGSGDEPSKI